MSQPALRVEVVGMVDVLRKLHALLDMVRRDVATLLQETTQEGQTRARSVAPVVTGALRAAITASRESDLAWVLSVQGAAQAYAAYVEYGTTHISARGYMRSGKEVMRARLQQGSRALAQTLPAEVARA